MAVMAFCPAPCGGEVAAGGKAPDGGSECLRCGRVFDSARAISSAGGGVAFICNRGRRPRCGVEGCERPQAALCDAPVVRAGRQGTCDASMCEAHRTRGGKNRDHCREHAGAVAGPGVPSR